jgi:hypothetical protein
LIEKPACGDFLPVVDGGYSLQYSPLLEYQEGRGLVVLCQLDVTGRTEPDPAAETLARNLLRHVASWTPPTRGRSFYVGEPAGRAGLESLGFKLADLGDGMPTGPDLLVVGPGGGRELARQADALRDWQATGGRLLALALEGDDLAACPGAHATVRRAEHISTGFAPSGYATLLRGVGPADVHIRDPRQVPLVTGGVRGVGDGVLAEEPGVVYFQLAPWQFSATNQANLRRTYRRVAWATSRLLANLGASSSTPLLERFRTPVGEGTVEARWREGFYLDQPMEWDDPYRFFRW